PESRNVCLEEFQRHGCLRDFEAVLRMRAGNLTFNISAEYVELRGTRFLLWELRDISRQKEAERQQEMLCAQLLQAQKMESVGRLAGGVAHDFNNLLTVINGYSDMILTGMRPEDPLRDRLGEIRHAGERAADLTRQLLVFSRNQVVQPRVINLNTSVTESAGLLGRLIGEDIHLVLTLEPDLAMISADPVQIHQVLMNLAVNARDAMPQGGSLT